MRPNVDTLYSAMLYDVSQKDLVIVIPDIDDRYWLFSFYDMYAFNSANSLALHLQRQVCK